MMSGRHQWFNMFIKLFIFSDDVETTSSYFQKNNLNVNGGVL